MIPAPRIPERDNETDAELALDARRGAPDALAALYRRHASALLAVAYRLLMSREDAEDVVHDVFVGLPEALARYDERGALGAWMKRVTVRVALTKLRREETRAEVALDTAPVARAPERDPATGISVADAMASLSPALRAVVVLKEIEGYTHTEIAEMLGISRGAAEVRLHRALRQLRAILTEGER